MTSMIGNGFGDGNPASLKENQVLESKFDSELLKPLNESREIGPDVSHDSK
jgi:hypothetical protein